MCVGDWFIGLLTERSQRFSEIVNNKAIGKPKLETLFEDAGCGQQKSVLDSYKK